MGISNGYFVGALRGRWLWLTEFISTSVMLLVTLVMIYGSYFHFLRAYQIGDSSGYRIYPLGQLSLLYFCAECVGAAFDFAVVRFCPGFQTQSRSSCHPVPLVEDAATIAAREAEALGSDK